MAEMPAGISIVQRHPWQIGLDDALAKNRDW